jgi:mRNA-degrading endonuclease toxin of MazEF toxin-antitoxin module
VKLVRGLVALIALDPTSGHEQQGTRPCILVNDPAVTRSQKYPMVCAVPVSSTPGQGALYPVIQAGSGGLRSQSYALVDQLRSVDKSRVIKVYQAISVRELLAIEDGIRLYLGLN